MEKYVILKWGLFGIFLFLPLFVLAQAKEDQDYLDRKNTNWFFSAELSLSLPDKIEYSAYGLQPGERAQVQDISGPASFDLDFSYGYLFFDTLSFSMTWGFQQYVYPKLQSIKLGGMLKWYPADAQNAYLLLRLENLFSLNKTVFKDGTNGRIGVALPIIRTKSFIIFMKVFKELVIFDFGDNAQSVVSNERPQDLTERSYGLGFLIQW